MQRFSPGISRLGTSIPHSIFPARHDLDGDRTGHMMPLMRIATVKASASREMNEPA